MTWSTRLPGQSERMHELMRMALVALVLVVGAGVVLWFGNTLNSWVLGGLIGGLAALLISIPISVTLFFHLSRRHEEQQRVRDEEAVALSQVHGYGRGRRSVYEEQVEVYEAESYLLPEGETWDEEEDDRQYYVRPRPAQPERYLPVPSQPRLPAQQPVAQPPAPRRRRDAGQPGSGKIPAARRASSTDTEYFPGFPGYQQRFFRSQQQMEARRAALEEAQNGHTGMTRSASTRKLSAGRPTTSFEQANYEDQLPTRAMPRQTARPNRPRRVVDSTSGLLADSGVHRSLPAPGETSASRHTQRPSSRHDEPDTEYLQERFPRQQTGPMYQQTGQLRQQQLRRQTGQTGQTGQFRRTGPIRQQTGQTGQTGQVRRNPNLEGQRRNPDVVTGSLRNPMVRRAPYMYEGDSLREELSQMIDPPTVRRSSRYESPQYEDDEEE
jgi:hypothetical protein